MSALARVERARAALVAALAGSALLQGALAFGAVILAGGLLDAALSLPLGPRRGIVPVAILVGVIAGGLRLWRGRHAASVAKVALYLEELVPGLQFALVTAIRPAGHSNSLVLDRVVEAAYSPAALKPPVLRALLRPLAGLLLVLIALVILPRGSLARVWSPRAGDALLAPRAAGVVASRLSPLVVRVVPPAYASRPAETLDDPASVPGLEGSDIVIRGRGAARAPAESLTALIGDGPVVPRIVADTWSVALVMPAKPEVVRLTDRGRTRLLTLEPVIDAPPSVRLVSPASDTTYQLPAGTLRLAATASDDFGLGRLWLELMITSGGGERFTTSTRTVAVSAPAGAGTAAVQAVLRLDTLGLGKGDVLNIRALARDRNDRTGPGEGSSDTRTIRIADPDQSDQIPIIPASAATLDTTVLSQRMLIIRAETLLVRRPRLPPDSFVAQAKRLGERQRMLYDRVQALILELETATDVGFVGETEESKLLRVAGLAMRRAEDHLVRARVSAALPEMYRALDALDKGRTSRRVYLRGMLPRVVVDVERVRLKGTDRAAAGPRTPRIPLPDPRRLLLERLDRILGSAGRAEAILIDSLTMLRVAALTDAPDAAPALLLAITALRERKDPAASLARFRRGLEREAESSPSLSLWRGNR